MLPPRHRHILHVQVDTAVPFLSRELENFIRAAITNAAMRASLESPHRDVQNALVERVSTIRLEAK